MTSFCFGRLAFNACMLRSIVGLKPFVFTYTAELHINRKSSSKTNHDLRSNRLSRLRSQVNIRKILFETDNCDQPDQAVNKHISDSANDTNDQGEPGRKSAMKTLLEKSQTMSAFKEKLQNYDGFQYSNDDWKTFENNVCAENSLLLKRWETLCMQLMCGAKCSGLATSLLDYLCAKDSPPNTSTLCLYMALQGQVPGPDKERIILNAFSKVQERTDVFDAITAQYIIIGLCATSHWRKALEVLEMVKLTTQPGSSYYGPIIGAALREDAELAFQLLDHMGLEGMAPYWKCFEQVLQISGERGDHNILERFFNHMGKFSWRMPKDVAQNLEAYFTQAPHEKWSCKWTEVNTVRGMCLSCKSEMRRIEVASSDFEALQRDFLEKAVVGGNVYLKSSPEEVERFKDFLMYHAPFDVVLDALNVAHIPFAKSKQLREIVHHFARERNMKVLVIGRAHMKSWPQADMASIQKHAKFFFTDDISSDDPFCLYATLYSGKDTFFVSKDLMRDHKFNLGQQRKEIFERWQKSRQINNFEVYKTGVSICMPSQFDCGPVKDANGWHIPYANGTEQLGSSSQTVLCLRYKGQRAANSVKRTKKNQAESVSKNGLC